jgi:hypothetical protein
MMRILETALDDSGDHFGVSQTYLRLDRKDCQKEAFHSGLVVLEEADLLSLHSSIDITVVSINSSDGV